MQAFAEWHRFQLKRDDPILVVRGVNKIVKITGIQGILKGGRITVPLTSCLTGLDQSVLQIKTKLSVVIQLIPNQSNRRSMVL